VGLARARGRGAADKLESESTGFHEKVRAAFRYLSESDPKRYVVLDATAPAEQISAAVLTSVEKVAKNVPTPLASDPTASQPTEPRSETDRETVP
jgi:dTMP kinase